MGEVDGRFDYWSIGTVDPPAEGSEHHWLLTPYHYAPNGFGGLDYATGEEFWLVLSWLRRHYRLDHYCLGSRSWDNGQIHVIVSQTDPPVTVRFDFGKPPSPPGSAAG